MLQVHALPTASQYDRPSKFAKGSKAWKKAVKDSVRYANAHFEHILNGEFTDIIGEQAIKQVQLRTSKGVDSQERPLARYSKRYQARKAKAGRYTGVVNLTWTGEMLKSLVFNRSSALKGYIKARPNRVAGGRITTQNLVRIHHRGEGRQKKRPFFSWRSNTLEDRRLKAMARLWHRRKMREAARRAAAKAGRA